MWCGTPYALDYGIAVLYRNQMQILPSTSVLSSSLAGISTGLDGAGKAAQAARDGEQAQRAEPAVSGEAERGDVVSLSSANEIRGAANAPAPVYAEIWKDGVKVAQVDIHGQVISASGLAMSGGGGLAGPLLAAQRAVQVAQQTGGEIRTAGQSLDSQTLLMRARLANAYAV
jgi:hypothetical protein